MRQCFLTLVVGAAFCGLLSGLVPKTKAQDLSQVLKDFLKDLAEKHHPKPPNSEGQRPDAWQPQPDYHREPPSIHNPQQPPPMDQDHLPTFPQYPPQSPPMNPGRFPPFQQYPRQPSPMNQGPFPPFQQYPRQPSPMSHDPSSPYGHRPLIGQPVPPDPFPSQPAPQNPFPWRPPFFQHPPPVQNPVPPANPSQVPSDFPAYDNPKYPSTPQETEGEVEITSATTAAPPSTVSTSAPTESSTKSNDTCGKNSWYTECINYLNTCEAKCKMNDDSGIIDFCCEAGCDCDVGYKSDANKNCIPDEECPKCSKEELPDDDSDKNHKISEDLKR